MCGVTAAHPATPSWALGSRPRGSVAKRWRDVEAADDRIGSPTASPVSVSSDTNAIVSASSTETAAGRALARRWPTQAPTPTASHAERQPRRAVRSPAPRRSARQ
jgi:hypothetical protein